jgi:hypothetical protein
MKGWFQRIARVFGWVPRTKWHLTKVEDAPDRLKPHTAYLVGEPGYEWTCAFRCPCGCGDVVWLNLIEAPGRPTWRVQQHARKTFSISPSVWRTTGCKSHFFVRRGRIDWC